MIVTLFESIDSTNTFLKSLRNKNTTHFCIAEQQTQGKGRLDRAWHSPFGKNIYLSCLYPIQKDISELGGLSLVVSLAIVNTLIEFMPADLLGVKWPNDVLYEGKKLSGTLIELQAESHGHCQAIIGIGINVNMVQDEKEISQDWISVRKITHRYIDRNLICTALINNLLAYLDRFVEKGLDVFMEEWRRVDCLHKKEIRLKNLMHQVKGVAMGINPQGHLLVEEDGIVKAYSSGDASQVRV